MKQSTRDKLANDAIEKIRILVEAENDIVNEEDGEMAAINAFADENPDAESVLEEARNLAEAVQAVEDGWEDANEREERRLREKYQEDEWNPETVIDEKIKEEQKDQVIEDLKDQIVNAFK